MSCLVNVEPRSNLKELGLKLWIADYFDELINQVDIYTENLFIKSENERPLTFEQQNEANGTRKKFLQIIETTELKNFLLFEENLKKVHSYFYQHLQGNELYFEDDQQVERVKAVLFEKFCFLMFDKAMDGCFKLKLISLDWFLDEYQKDTLKYNHI